MFKHAYSQIVIDDGSAFMCDVSEFLEFYPDYAGLPSGMVVLVYDEDGHTYMSNGADQLEIDPSIDTSVLQSYVDNLATIKDQIENDLRKRWWVAYDDSTLEVLYPVLYQQVNVITLSAGESLSTSNLSGDIPADLVTIDYSTTPPTNVLNYTYDSGSNTISHK